MDIIVNSNNKQSSCGKKQCVFLILHNIRSAYNVGSIFRTADACGVSKVYLTGYTPCPIDKFGKERKDIAKSALGGEKNISWEYYKKPSLIIEKLKKDRVFIVAIEQSKNSVDYKNLKINYPVAFVLGNELRGISKQILDKCDAIAEISMKGKKESLNVSVSAGIALFRILNI